MSKHTVEQIRAHAKMLAEYEDPQICNADTAEILTAYADLLEQIERARDRVTKDATVSLCAEMARFISGRVAYDKEAISLVDRAATLQSVAHLLPRGERGGVDAGMAAALRKIAAIRWQSAAINGCAHEAAKIASADLESALAQPASPEQPAGRQWDVWVVADGGRDGENRFRTLKEGMPAWTLDQDDAIQFARRDDAERFAAEDEDAWRILPIPQSAAPVGVPDGMVLVPAKFGIKADAWEAAQFVFGGPGTGEGESFMDCTAWIGEVVDEDDGTKTHGLHVSCNECPEEGSITLAEFAAAPSAPQEKEQPE